MEDRVMSIELELHPIPIRELELMKEFLIVTALFKKNKPPPNAAWLFTIRVRSMRTVAPLAETAPPTLTALFPSKTQSCKVKSPWFTKIPPIGWTD
jgi:hypothetical protein